MTTDGARELDETQMTVFTTEPRGVVGFEVVLGALLAAVDGGVVFSIHGLVEHRHGLL